MDCHIFACETKVWQCFAEGHEDLFQGNFPNNNTYDWRDFWQFTTKINCAKVDGNLQFATAANIDAMS